MTERCYVYAVLAREIALPPRLTGLGGTPVSVVPCRSLAAATGLLDGAEPRPTPENLLQHEAVVEALRSGGPVLPVRFGTVLTNQGAVAQALAERYATLSADLAYLGDKVELGLAVLWDPKELDHEEPRGRRGGALDADLAPRLGPGARYLMERLAQYREETVLQARAQALARDLDDVLRRYALESRRTVLPTPRMVLRTAYLVEPFRVEAFRQAFEEIRQTRPYLRLLLSGPWPPYSFVTPPESPAPLDRPDAFTFASPVE